MCKYTVLLAELEYVSVVRDRLVESMAKQSARDRGSLLPGLQESMNTVFTRQSTGADVVLEVLSLNCGVTR